MSRLGRSFPVQAIAIHGAYVAPAGDATVSHVIGNLVLGAAAPTSTVTSTVTHVIGNLVLGASAPTFTVSGSVTHVIGNVALGASSPSFTSTSSVPHVIGELVLGAGTHAGVGNTATTTIRQGSSFAPAILYLVNQEGPLA